MSGGTSPLLGRVRFAAASLDGDEPVDTVLARDALFSSALHLGDEYGQVRANWSALDPSYSDAQLEPRQADPTNTTDWFRAMPLGPVALTLFASRRPYRLRLRLGGASSAGHSVSFCIAVGPTPETLLAIANDSIASQTKLYTGVTSTTPAWLTPDDGIGYLDLPDGALGTSSIATLTDLSGSGTDVLMWRCYVDIYGRTANTSSKPEVWGFHLGEYAIVT